MSYNRRRSGYQVYPRKSSLPGWVIIAAAAPLIIVLGAVVLMDSPKRLNSVTSATQAVGWDAGVTVEGSVIKFTATVTRPDPLSTLVFRLEGGNRIVEVCAVPLSAPRISCEYDPKKNGFKDGTVFRGYANLTMFTGAISSSEDLGRITWEESRPGIGALYIVVGLLVCLALSGAFGLWRRKR